MHSCLNIELTEKLSAKLTTKLTARFTTKLTAGFTTKLTAGFVNGMVALTCALGALPALTVAQTQTTGAPYPSKPITLVIPFPAGSGTDAVGRIFAVEMGNILGQQVVVENKPGGNATIGAQQVARAQPDGYTLFLATNTPMSAAPWLMKSIPYDPIKDFTPIARGGNLPFMLVINPKLPVKTVQELVAYAKKNPGKLNYASGNSTGIVGGATLAVRTGIDIVHVPYKGTPQAMTDLVGGQVDLMFATAAGAAPLLDSGKLRALGVTAAERSDARPDIPTIAESGVPGYVAQSWYGLLAPTGTPANVVARLNAAAAEAVKTEGFKTRVTEEGLVVSTGPPEQMETFVRNEEKRWSQVVRDAHITTN